MTDEERFRAIQKNMPTGRCGNIHRRANYQPEVGNIINGHDHNFDHMMQFLMGDARVEATDLNGVKHDRIFGMSSPFGTWCLVKKGVKHKITSVTPWTIFLCVYSLRFPDGEVSEVDTGWQEAFV